MTAQIIYIAEYRAQRRATVVAATWSPYALLFAWVCFWVAAVRAPAPHHDAELHSITEARRVGVR